jgi:purine-nucleoside phosphorylase
MEPSTTQLTARLLCEALGPPQLGLVLGSGFGPLADTLGAHGAIPLSELPALPTVRIDGQGDGVAVAEIGGRRIWVFLGRFHLYQGLQAADVVAPISVLAAAGAGAVVLTCACGGLSDDHEIGELILVRDHLNLTGADPLRGLTPGGDRPTFLDLQDAYDPELRRAWGSTAAEHGIRLREGVLAALPGPCYETPAEVTMLRRLGAELATMSTVPEVIAARYHGLRVAALACVSNPGAGLPGPPIRHDRVLDTVAASVTRAAPFLRSGLARTLELVS